MSGHFYCHGLLKVNVQYLIDGTYQWYSSHNRHVLLKVHILLIQQFSTIALLQMFLYELIRLLNQQLTVVLFMIEEKRLFQLFKGGITTAICIGSLPALIGRASRPTLSIISTLIIICWCAMSPIFLILWAAVLDYFLWLLNEKAFSNVLNDFAESLRRSSYVNYHF